MSSKVGDIGTVYRLRLIDQDSAAVDLSSAQTLTVEFERPNGTRFEKSAVIETSPGTDGYLKYENTSADGSILDMAGTWKFRGRAVFSDNDRFTGGWIEETVVT